MPVDIASAEAVRISVDNGHCHLYGLCQQEAPATFALGEDGRLRHATRADGDEVLKVVHAARICPMQAITLVEARS